MPLAPTQDACLYAAIRNLWLGCAGARPGERVLVVHEPAAEAYYEPGLAAEVAAGAARLGLAAELHETPFEREATGPGPVLAARMACADRVLWLARLGDQTRFRPCARPERQTVCYALTRGMLASAFGTADHAVFLELKRMIDRALARARRIRITCPLGTEVEGGRAAFPPGGGDVGVRRFPQSVFTPVPAEGFAGRIVQEGFLVGAGCRYYAPYACELDGTLAVRIEGGRIEGFGGGTTDVARARAHYAAVGARFGLDPWRVHSWHAGIHPGCAFADPAAESFERWSGAAFGNPRILHFHTCGAHAPGEISLNVLDPTVEVDGVAIWEGGRLHPDRLPGGAALLAGAPEVARLFAAPRPEVGLSAEGRLSYR